MAKHSMAPITVLKKGLNKLKQKVQIRKADLEARLQKKEKLTWLDNDGNIIQEQWKINFKLLGWREIGR